MGLALDLWNSFEFHATASGVTVETFGEGAGLLPEDETNLTASVFLSEVAELGCEPLLGFKIICHNTVPCASGLGSSSTATLAGVIFARALERHRKGLDPSELDVEAVLSRAVAIEGHGDNVAPALMGGFVIVVPDITGVLTQQVPHSRIRTVVCVPEFKYLTHEARAALPDEYSKADAIYNIGRAMLVAEALRAGDDHLLARAMSDRIHEPYRLKSIPGAEMAKRAAKDAGAIAVCLSGAGPGVISFASTGFSRIGAAMKEAFADAGLQSRYWILYSSESGVQVGRLPV
jgi:homoserine kinase